MSEDEQSFRQVFEQQIEQLYDEIQARIEASPAAEQAGEIESAYARLRELQAAEAAKFRKRFIYSLKMPIDTGEKLLGRARALREYLEDLAPSDPTFGGADAS